MDKRTVLAFVLSFVVLVGWSLFFAPKPEQTPPRKEPSTAQTPAPPSPEVRKTPAPAEPAQSPATGQTREEAVPKPEEREIEINTPLYRAVFSNVGPTIKSFKLKKYRQTTDPDSPPVDLVTIKKNMGDFLLFSFDNHSVPKNAGRVFQVDREFINLGEDSSPQTLVFRATTGEGVTTTQTFRFYPDQYRIDLDVEVANGSANPVEGAFKAELRAMPPKDKGGYYAYVGFALLLDNELKEVEVEDPSEEQSLRGKMGWVSYEDNYFISAVVPDVPSNAVFTGRHLTSGVLEGAYFLPPASVGPQGVKAAKYELYLGPRDLGILKGFGKGLDQAINFGWTDIIAKPLLYILRFFDKYIHNYGVSIILLTILVKALFWPLTHKSYKSMKEMQKLQPRMAKLREKYKGDKQKLNQEMMALYKTYKVNPMGGCLPMIIQIPVFFALFRVLGGCIELRHAPFALWINDLSAPDRLFNFHFQIPFMSPPYGIPVLTLLMGASMFLQQKMTPTPGDPTQAKIMMFLPVIFTFMFINFPSGLVLYWLVNNILSIAQQYRIHKKPA
ncbi:MAG: membrane protein insertase YidC [Deltaproteobacteria bacterium]|nr:membrane protein insertase YidC [Deltaproteobacteria bacterium]MBW2351729.1 membrane protein insertase YidC [Deltaproteobacteria bacterium]